MPTEITTLRAILHRILLAATCACGLGAQAAADAVDVGSVVAANGLAPERATILVERLSDGQVWLSNAERTNRRYSPASTSKIPHLLIALERGIATPDTVFQWDSTPRNVHVWNRDHILASAFQNSVVWAFQQIATSAGRETMAAALADFDYGNADVGTTDQLTTYWLDDTLVISAVEQVRFLARLAQGDLPLSARTFQAANAIMISDQGAGWTMRSKTGWRYAANDMDIGWHVGWLECAEDSYVFATNIDMPDTRSLSKRTALTYAVLDEIGAFDCID